LLQIAKKFKQLQCPRTQQANLPVYLHISGVAKNSPMGPFSPVAGGKGVCAIFANF